MRLLPLFLVMSLLTATSFGAVIEHVGSYTNWGSANWDPITGLNDQDNAITQDHLDFVGDSLNAGAYWADNGTYLFFRVRVDAGTVTASTFSDALLILIDVDNYLYGTGFGTDAPKTPDYALAWDSNQILKNHGFEMSRRGIVGQKWETSSMDDLDGSAGQKLANDINGDGRTTDGYIRSVDGQSTTNFGTTSFIDFAVSWSYLETYTDLERGQKWNLALGSIANATDHNLINTDIASGAGPDSAITTGWQAVPEPTVISLISLTGVMALIGRRIFDRFFR